MSDRTSTAITCVKCDRPLGRHIHYSDAPNDGTWLEKACFDPTDFYWEGYYCPPGENGFTMTLRPIDLVMVAVFFVALSLLITTGPADSTIESSVTTCERG